MKHKFKVLFLLPFLTLIFVFSGCSNTNEIEVQDINGETLVISTENLSDIQIEELNKKLFISLLL